MFSIEAYNQKIDQWEELKEIDVVDIMDAELIYKTYFSKDVAKTGLRLLDDYGRIVRLCHA